MIFSRMLQPAHDSRCRLDALRHALLPALLCTLLLGLLFWPSAARAVTSLEQIERLEAVYGALLDYRPGAPPGPQAPWQVALGAELVPIPAIDARVGAKNEPVSAPPASGRVRAGLGLPWGLSLGAAWLPQFRVLGYKVDSSGWQLDYGFALDNTALGNLRVGLRAFTLHARVQGPISDPNLSDTFSLASQGADARLGWAWEPWVFYGGGGSSASRTRLEIASDGSVLEFSRTASFMFAGISRALGPWRLTVEQQQTENYLRHLVLTGLYAF